MGLQKINNLTNLTVLSVLMLLVFSLYGCRTSKRLVEKTRSEIVKKEFEINKLDSSIIENKIISSTKLDSISWGKNFEQYDIDYNGTQNSDYLTIEKTLKGISIKGVGSVKAKAETTKKDSVKIYVDKTKIENNTNINLDKKNITDLNELKSDVNKNKSASSIGLTFTSALLIIFIFIIFCYFYFKFKK